MLTPAQQQLKNRSTKPPGSGATIIIAARPAWSAASSFSNGWRSATILDWMNTCPNTRMPLICICAISGRASTASRPRWTTWPPTCGLRRKACSPPRRPAAPIENAMDKTPTAALAEQLSRLDAAMQDFYTQDFSDEAAERACNKTLKQALLALAGNALRQGAAAGRASAAHPGATHRLPGSGNSGGNHGFARWPPVGGVPALPNPLGQRRRRALGRLRSCAA